MSAPDSRDKYEPPTVASSRFKITKEGIESEQSVPGEHAPTLLSGVILTICGVLAVAAPMLTFEIADSSMSPAGLLVVVLAQEFVVLCIAAMAWVARKR